MNSTADNKIAIDAMGGDFAPMNEILGAIDFSKEFPNIEIVLVGDESKIKNVLETTDCSQFNYSIHHAEEVVSMDDEATAAIKRKKNSSLFIGLDLHKEGKVNAFVSAGNTGAILSTSTVLLGRIKGVSRPTIGSFFPTKKKLPTLVLDVGANVDSKPKFLYEFAVMGGIYYKNMFDISNPSIGLLNIGEESSKGTADYKEANKILADSDLNFIGNVEGRDVFNGDANVIVCDGFVGNIILKMAESFLGFFKTKIKQFADKSFLNKIKVALMIPSMKGIAKDLDYQEYGGVPVLGVNGVSIIGHGKSTPKAIYNMLLKAKEIIEKDINGKIEKALA